MTGVAAKSTTASSPLAPDGGVLMEFRAGSSSEANRTPDPSGACATFEARGYTAWDPTSNAFIKDRTLCIPTAFCSYGGEASDKRPRSCARWTPSRARRCGSCASSGTRRRGVLPSVGPEQEYFLVDAELL